MADNPRIEELRRRVLADPASIAFAALAEEYRRTGNYAEAIETCRVGLQRHPSYLSARVTLGRALMETAQYDEARTELELVLKSAPENLAAIRGLAEIHERQDSLPETDSYRRAAAARPPLATSSTATLAAATSVADNAAAIAAWSAPPKAPEPVPVRQTEPVTVAPTVATPVTAASVTAPAVAAAPVMTAPVISAAVMPAPVIAAPVMPASVTTTPVTAAPVVAVPVVAAPVVATVPDPAIARLEQFLVAVTSARASSRISR
jgi:hypothetical protein